ncbi:MAG: amidase [Thermomicrobiales bacterium]
MSIPGPRTATVSRRSIIKWGAAAAAVPAVAGASAAGLSSRSGGEPNRHTVSLAQNVPFPELEEATIAELRSALDTGRMSARELVDAYLVRIDAIDRHGPRLNSVMEVNPEAQAIADALDQELATSGPRGPLHGIPILLKDNIDTADQMLTTAGSLALVDAPPPAQDAFVVQRLREAGAVILGKTTLSEWANFRSTRSTSGWSGRGGQCLNPYALDCSPCGSSSGSPAAVSANLTAAALGTETDGSIVCPSSACGVVGIKPTVGLTSRSGAIPIAHSQDTVGPHGRTVADAAAVLGALTGVDPRDPMTSESADNAQTDYTQFLDPNGLNGARIGVMRGPFFGYSPQADAITEAAIEAMRRLGAEIIDPAELPSLDTLFEEPGEFEVLLYEFKADLAAYLATRGPDSPVQTLADLIRFNEEHPDAEMPYFEQEIFYIAEEKGPLTDQVYLDALEKNHRLSRQEGIDAVMDQHQLDALVAPTGSPAWKIDLINADHFLGASSSPAAMAGYPIVTVPAGDAFGLPVNISFTGRAYSEPTLIRIAHAFEQATRMRQVPRFLVPAVEPPATFAAVRAVPGPSGTPMATPTT